jgi:hypothetical protein
MCHGKVDGFLVDRTGDPDRQAASDLAGMLGLTAAGAGVGVRGLLA